MKNLETLGGLDPRVIEGLLSCRPKYDEQECEYSVLIASYVQGVASTDEIESAEVHLASCIECQNAVALFRNIEKAPTNSVVQLPTSKQKRGFRVPHRTAALAVAATMVLAFGFVLYRNAASPLPVEETLRVKGEGDAVFVAVKRGPAEFSMRPLDKLEDGDNVGFFYSAENEGFAALFNIDNQGVVTRLFPLKGETGAPIREAQRAPLPDGASVGKGFGCEWLIAVFSDTPFDLGMVEEFLQQSPRENGTQTCDYDPRVPGARSVIVLPFRR